MLLILRNPFYTSVTDLGAGQRHLVATQSSDTNDVPPLFQSERMSLPTVVQQRGNGEGSSVWGGFRMSVPRDAAVPLVWAVAQSSTHLL